MKLKILVFVLSLTAVLAKRRTDDEIADNFFVSLSEGLRKKIFY